jgi:hypothetical protein
MKVICHKTLLYNKIHLYVKAALASLIDRIRNNKMPGDLKIKTLKSYWTTEEGNNYYRGNSRYYHKIIYLLTSKQYGVNVGFLQ